MPWRRRLLLALVPCSACAAAGSGDTSESPTTSGPVATTKSDQPQSTTAADTSSTTTGGEGTSAAASTSGSTSSGATESTGASACTKRVVVMGYWPPTNEMLRPWSTNATQNPSGWTGENWRGHGYDVHAFFPEFPPDGDPTNDQLGEPGSVGSPDFDLRVDYQATSADFWRIVDEQQPSIVLTSSRGGGIGWEIEALEGGHGDNRGADPSTDWASDLNGRVTLPTEATVDPRSWDAISTFRVGNTLPSALPLDAIFDATDALGLTQVAIDRGTSGNFLSGFLGLHGIYYKQQTRFAVAGGHIHVGARLPVATAIPLLEATLEAILVAHPADRSPCP